METGHPVTTPRSCIGNEAEKQGHLEKEGTALTSSLNSELAEYLLKKSLPLIGKNFFFLSLTEMGTQGQNEITSRK